jgi:putative ABC transport system permease protein
VSLANSRSRFPGSSGKYVISVVVNNPDLLDPSIEEAEALFRNVRRVRIGDESNFEITRSDSLANTLIESIQKVALFISLIGFITLLSAAIALMNILLVSVTERTREIGITKAIGARKSNIRFQFLVEALVICQLGGIIGIIFGILIGNVTSYFLHTRFVIPWLWLVLAVLITMVVGIISGIYPAYKASKLDPIEALRYE